MIRHLKTFAACSLLLNMLLIGMLLGYRGSNLLGCNLHSWEEMIAALPSPEHAASKRAMDDIQTNSAEIRQKIDEAREKQAMLLEADPFNKTSYLAQAQQVQQLRDQIHNMRTETIASMATQMTPQDRSAMAKALRDSNHY